MPNRHNAADLVPSTVPWVDVPMVFFDKENALRPKITYHHRQIGLDEEVEARRGFRSIRKKLPGLYKLPAERRSYWRMRIISDFIHDQELNP